LACRFLLDDAGPPLAKDRARGRPGPSAPDDHRGSARRLTRRRGPARRLRSRQDSCVHRPHRPRDPRRRAALTSQASPAPARERGRGDEWIRTRGLESSSHWRPTPARPRKRRARRPWRPAGSSPSTSSSTRPSVTPPTVTPLTPLTPRTAAMPTPRGGGPRGPILSPRRRPPGAGRGATRGPRARATAPPDPGRAPSARRVSGPRTTSGRTWPATPTIGTPGSVEPLAATPLRGDRAPLSLAADQLPPVMTPVFLASYRGFSSSAASWRARLRGPAS